MRLHASRPLVAALVSTLLLGAPCAAHAGQFRSYLSKSGSDANPCTLPQPCRQLPAALAATNDGGEVWMLDSANYNSVPIAIEKSVTILAVPGAAGSVAGVGTNAITIGSAVNVTLRNLSIVNPGPGINGITVISPDTVLLVERCEVFGFTAGSGILVEAAARVSVVDSIVRDNDDGITADRGATMTIAHTKVLNNTNFGIVARPTIDSVVNVVVTDSVVNGNTSGLVAAGSAAERRSNLYAHRTVASGNGTGFATEGSAGVIVLDNSTSTGNTVGVSVSPGTVVNSTGTNLVYGNLSQDVSGALTPLARR